MPRVKFLKSAVVRDRSYVRGATADLDDEAAKDAAKTGVVQILGETPIVATDPKPIEARKAVKLGG